MNTALGIAQNDDSADFIRSLNNRIGLPANLSEMGVNSDSIPSLADHAVKDICTYTNPRACSLEEYEKLFRIALG